jgi:hypothetical protein
MLLRLAVPICALALAAGCGEAEETSGGTQPAIVADLTVSVDRDGPRGPEKARETRVECASEGAGGEGCEIADALKSAAFAPVPQDRACTQIFGGPETAHVTGTLRGTDIDARFARNNGCEIERWKQVAPLLDAA